MKLKAVFFDIDGTLMLSSSAGKIALEKAIKECTGVDNALNNIRLHGNTDLIIFRNLEELFAKKKISIPDFKTIKKLYFEFLPKILYEKKVKLPLDGVYDLLHMLKDLSIKPGLVTGNFRRSAFQKLNATKMDHYFLKDKLGEFGDYSEKRSEILCKAIEHSGFKRDEIIFVGDTPFDGNAGKLCNITTVGVSTGIYGPRELLESGCHIVLKSLKEMDEILLNSLLG